ncbi:MAG: hypothetical protein ACK4E7_15335 [Permianibacter sp.]
MKKQEFRPQADNRVATLHQIVMQLNEHEPLRKQRLTNCIEMLKHKQPGFGQVLSGFDYYNQGLGVYIAELLKEERCASLTLKSCIVTGMHASLFERFLYERENSDYKATNPFVSEIITLHGMAAEAGYGEFCDWLGDYICLLLSSEAGELLQAIDPDFVCFFRRLLGFRKTAKFDAATLSGGGVYDELLASINDFERLQAFLPRYCDFRWSNAFGWNDVNAKKKRPASQQFPSSIFSDVSWKTLIPFELFSLKYVYKSVYKKELFLNADHPLLSGSFTSIELPKEEVENELIGNLGYAIDSSIGRGWRSMFSRENR